jgi:hypothetical protein
VAAFGLKNALFPIGDKLLEIVSPTKPGTTAGRLLDKRGGDGGYMVMLEVDDLAPLRRRFDEVGARVVYEPVGEGIVGLHLHPGDVGGAILSIDRADTWGEWPWAGPVWRQHVRDEVVAEVLAVEIEAVDPSAMSTRWGEVLGRRVVDDTIALDEGEIRFLPAGDRGDGVCGFELRVSDPGRADQVEICGCRFQLTAG